VSAEWPEEAVWRGGGRRKFRRPQGRRARFRRFEASQHACFSGEVEGVMAELLGILAERGEARNGGVKRRPELGFRAREEERTGYGREREMIGSRERASATLSSPREQRRRASPRRDRRPEPHQAAAWLPVGRRQRIFMYNPLHLAIFPELRK
jgi:hypothetical protein